MSSQHEHAAESTLLARIRAGASQLGPSERRVAAVVLATPRFQVHAR